MAQTDAFKMMNRTVGASTALSMQDLGFTLAELNQARQALVTAGANPIRYTVNGQPPTSTVGHYLAANGNLTIDSRGDCFNLQLLALGGNSIVTVTISRGESQ